MSKENVELVLDGIRRFEASDFDGLASLWHEDSRMSGPEGWPEQGPFEGREAVLQQFRRLTSDWDKNEVADVEVVVQREGWVVLSFRWETRGDKSGVPASATLAAAYRIEGGRLREAHFRWTLDQALEAAGLSE